MSTPTKTSTTTTARGAARVSRLRVLALAERERYQHGWSFLGDGVTQRCPCCRITVRATAPAPPADPGQLDQYSRKVNDLLNDAVADHVQHECPAPAEGQHR